mgnify:CR=1 FL=1
MPVAVWVDCGREFLAVVELVLAGLVVQLEDDLADTRIALALDAGRIREIAACLGAFDGGI